MGRAYNRGTRKKPNWYLDYTDAAGRRCRVPSGQHTKAAAVAILREVEAREGRLRLGLEVAPTVSPEAGPLFEIWLAQLTNRSASRDSGQVRRHVAPYFARHRIADITVQDVIAWLGSLEAAAKSPAISRQALANLSRFFGWCVGRGLRPTNPVRDVPRAKRPRLITRPQPWLEDDGLVPKILAACRSPLREIFYLGNRSGMRKQEIVGLRLSDLGWLKTGVIRVRFSGDGPLKEDRYNENKVKWVPAANDCRVILAPWRSALAHTAPEDYLFPSVRDPAKHFHTTTLHRRWDKVRECLGLELTFYQATRHTFTSRALANGASLDEVSAALGHSSPAVTRRHYDHFVRKSFSQQLRQPVGEIGDS